MQKEAELHADEDKKAKESIEIRNNADNLAYQCEKQLKDLGDKIPGDKKAEIEKHIETVREALKGNDIDAIKTAYTELQNNFQSVSEDLYKQASASTRRRPQRPPPTAWAGVRPERRPTATSSTRSSRSWTTTRRSNVTSPLYRPRHGWLPSWHCLLRKLTAAVL